MTAARGSTPTGGQWGRAEMGRVAYMGRLYAPWAVHWARQPTTTLGCTPKGMLGQGVKGGSSLLDVGLVNLIQHGQHTHGAEEGGLMGKDGVSTPNCIDSTQHHTRGTYPCQLEAFEPAGTAARVSWCVDTGCSWETHSSSAVVFLLWVFSSRTVSKVCILRELQHGPLCGGGGKRGCA